MKFYVPILLLCLSISLPKSAIAEDRWQFEGAFYLYMPESKTSLNTALGPIDASLSFKDALQNLDFGFMGAFAAQRGRWTLLADFNYTDLTFSNPTSGASYSQVDTELTTQFLSGYALYEAVQSPSLTLEVGGGLRWFSTDTKFTLQPGLLPGQSRSANENWIDPLLAARIRVPLSAQWTFSGMVDYGGFSPDSETWQALAVVEYAFAKNWSAVGGYRHISFDHDIDGEDFGFSQSGPLLGVKYKF